MKSYDKGNWFRWGENDQRGALNFITAEKTVRATKVVQRGKVYSLALPITHTSYGVPNNPRAAPPIHVSTVRKNAFGNISTGSDYVTLFSHGQTHIDALSHVWTDGVLYNNFSEENATSFGSEKCGIGSIGGIVTRGVLLDLARFKGVDSLARGESISDEDLYSCAKAEGIRLESGDAVLLRTGYLTTFDKKNPVDFFRGEPGLAKSASKLFDDREIAIVGADTYAVEVEPTEDGDWGVPIHLDLLWKRGIPLIEVLLLC